MLYEFLIPFGTIALAELGDKTQLVVLCLASKTRKHGQLLLGLMLGFLLADGLAVLFGGAITKIVPDAILKALAGGLFLFFGVRTLLEKGEEREKCEMGMPIWSGLATAFILEMGDKTQLSAALFATQYSLIPVFLAVMAALFALTLAEILVGRELMKRVDRKRLSLAAGALFILLGIAMLVSIVL